MWLTVNKTIKQFESAEFSEYFADTVARALAETPNMDVGDINVDTRVSVVRPMQKCLECLKLRRESSGWRGQVS